MWADVIYLGVGVLVFLLFMVWLQSSKEWYMVALLTIFSVIVGLIMAYTVGKIYLEAQAPDLLQGE